MDVPLTDLEIFGALKECKMNKSSATPITYDMIKHDNKLLCPYIRHIFNCILISHAYPKAWKLSHLIPIFKAGDQSIPSNYRGIAIGTHIAKLFAKCINTRVEKYLKEQNLLPDNSLGFRKGIRTEDAMFVLKTVADKYKKLGKRMYTIFIDFAKFYDTIDHHILLEKLYGIGITGNIFQVIKNMYENVQYCIKLFKNGESILTKPFVSNIGLKQGCPLSPMLANIFLIEIHNALIQNDIEIDNIPINSISWADDLVFFSLDKASTQKALNSLCNFCQKAKLQVNIDKTKAMIISNGFIQYTRDENFKFDDRYIDFVNSYKYLGIEFQRNGKFNTAIKSRLEKAKNATFVIKQACATESTTSIEVYKKLYETKIFPILMYGSAIWGSPTNNRIRISHEKPINKETLSNAVNINLRREIPLYNFRLTKNNKCHATFECPSYNDKIEILSNTPLASHYKTEPFCIENDHNDVETFINKHAKQIIKVKKSCNNHIARKHIGWTPITLRIWMTVLKYWRRTVTGTENTLLNATYNCAKSLDTKWLQGIQHLLETHGMYDLWLDPTIMGNEACIRYMRQKLHDTEEVNTNQKILESKKLREFNKYCKIPKCAPNYLLTINDPRHRTTITKLRTHTHCLQTETGSYAANSNDPNRYICKKCEDNTEEDIKHFIFYCKWQKLIHPRTELINYIELLSPNIKTQPKDTWISLILEASFENVEVKNMQNIYRLIHKMYHYREKEPPVNIDQTDNPDPQPTHDL